MAKQIGAKPLVAKSGKKFVPERGDLIWLHFSPQSGREQAGRRPALVISPKFYNIKSGLCLLCPITSKIKGYPFEQVLPEGLGVEGIVLIDQLRSIDWQARGAEFIEVAPQELLVEVVSRLLPLIDTQNDA